MKGTWQTGDHPAGHLAVLAVIAAVLLGSGAAAAVASVIMTIVIIAGVLAALAAIALAVLVAWRVRHAEPVSAVLAERAAAVRAEALQARVASRPAGGELQQPDATPRELHQHVHFHGVDEDRAAEILRRHQAPGQ